MTWRTSAEWAHPQAAEVDAAVDVLIPTFNRPAELAVTLSGLAAQSEPGFRVVISDQSEEAVWEQPAVGAMVRVLKVQGRQVSLLRHLPRQGLAEQRHFLLQQSDADKVLFLDDDVWLEPGALQRMAEALEEIGCGFVGMGPQGLSYLDDRRPEQTRLFSPWVGRRVQPETVEPDTPEFDRWPLHNAANLSHLSAELGLKPGDWVPYRVAWLGGCALYRRQALQDVGGFHFWPMLPSEHSGEDVLSQWRVMEKYGGAGILPSGAVHLEAPTTIPNRKAEAYRLVPRQSKTSGTS